MKFATSFFNRTIFVNQLKRFWPLYTSYFVLWLLIVPLQLIGNLRSARMHGWDMEYEALSQIVNTGFYGGALMAVVFSIFFAMAAFYYLYNSRSVSQMGSLPVTREGTFLSVYLPGLAVMLGTQLVISLLSLAITAFYGLSVAVYIFQAFAMMSLMTLFFYGFASFVAMLTGNILVLPLVYGVLNFTAAGVVLTVYNILEKFVYGMMSYSGDDSPLLLFSPIVYIISKTSIYSLFDGDGGEIRPFCYDGWGYLIAIAVAGLILTGLALVLVKRRRMETAGDVVAVSPLKPVFKYCLSFGCALIMGSVLYYLLTPDSYYDTAGLYRAVSVLMLMVLGAFIGYFAAEMLIHKSLRVFGGRKWRGFAAVVGILVVFTAVSEFDLFGFERNIPEAADVESATFYGFGPMTAVIDTDDIQTLIDIHKSIVENKAQHESPSLDGYKYSFFINYFMHDGSMIERYYQINTDVTEDISAIVDFLNSPNIVLARSTPTVDDFSVKNISEANISSYNGESGHHSQTSITSEEAYELYSQCILPDIKDGTMGFIDSSWLDIDNGFETMNCSINIYFFSRSEDGRYFDEGYLNVSPTDKSLRTNKWLEEHGFEVRPYTETQYYQ